MGHERDLAGGCRALFIADFRLVLFMDSSARVAVFPHLLPHRAIDVVVRPAADLGGAGTLAADTTTAP